MLIWHILCVPGTLLAVLINVDFCPFMHYTLPVNFCALFNIFYQLLVQLLSLYHAHPSTVLVISLPTIGLSQSRSNTGYTPTTLYHSTKLILGSLDTCVLTFPKRLDCDVMCPLDFYKSTAICLKYLYMNLQRFNLCRLHLDQFHNLSIYEIIVN